MKQTAVEWLTEQITTIKWKMSDVSDRNLIIKQAKAMEKEQIIDAYLKDNIEEFDVVLKLMDKGEQYYNETYKSK
jgi:hypothetical protein